MTPLPTPLLERVAAAAVAEGLADAVFTRLSTPFGRLLVIQGPAGVVRIGFEEEPEDRLLAEVAAVLGPRLIASDGELAITRDALAAYLEGDVDELEVPVDLSLVAAPFRRGALETLRREVPRGTVITYAALAGRAGHPRAARAVGTACARNPVPIVVPCHRVVPSTGGVGSYAGGPARKEALLALEGASGPSASPHADSPKGPLIRPPS